jgi:hypothetical protein
VEAEERKKKIWMPHGVRNSRKKKLKIYGFQEEALTWIETFLMRRTKVVQIQHLNEENVRKMMESEIVECTVFTIL